MGIAFQLRDDLIGLFGVTADTGKPFGSDLRAGKPTVAAKYAISRARGSDRRILAEVFGNSRATVQQLHDAVRVFESVGAKQVVERRIARLLSMANHQLRLAPITDDGRQLLASAATALALRSV